MSLISKRDIGHSMLELSIAEEEEDSPRFKESKGLLRRAFSSKKRKNKKDLNSSLRLSQSVCTCFGAVPFPGGYSQGDIDTATSRLVFKVT